MIRQMPMTEVMSKVQEQRRFNEDVTMPMSEFLMESDGTILARGTGQRFQFNDFSMTQAFNRLGIPVRYGKKLFAERPDLVAEEFNHWKSHEDKVVLFRNRRVDGRTSVIRGFLSDSYAKYDDTDLVETLMQTGLGEKYGQALQFYADDKRMHIRFVMESMEVVAGKTVTNMDDILNVGVDVINSEVGASSLVLSPLVYRQVCTNGMRAWRQSDDSSRFRHAYRTEQVFYTDVVESLDTAIRGGDGMIRQFLEMKSPDKFVQNPLDVIEQLTKDSIYSKETTEKIKDNYLVEPEKNWYGIINAVTRTARDMDDEKRMDMEQFAGDLLGKYDEKYKTFALAQ